MDKSLYIAMTGATETLKAQAVNAHNLANISTPGFRAALSAASALPIQGEGFDSRVNIWMNDPGFDPSAGMINTTGRPLDVAITAENGWLAVQALDGETGYTRAGNLQVTSLGQLVTGNGHPVLSEGGPITLPPFSQLTIAPDGTVTVQPQGSGPESPAVVGRLQVVGIEPDQIQRGQDGLMRLKPEGSAAPLPGAVLAIGSLESSNVSAADAMVRMIELSRQFELQVKAMDTADENARSSASLLRSQ